jgi:membrane protein
VSAGAAAPLIPETPVGLPWSAWRAALRGAVRETKLDDVPSLAAGVAFKIFLALLPALIAGVAVIGLIATPKDIQALVLLLQGVAPAAVVELIRNWLSGLIGGQGSGAGGIAVAGVLVGVWTASSAAVTLMRALNRAYDVERPRPFLRQRLVSLLITVALLAAIVAMLLLLVFGPRIEDALVPAFVGDELDALFTVGRYAAAIVVLMALFAFVYRIGPNRDHPRWTWISPGAVLGVAGWLLLSFLFSVYTTNFGRFDETYGTLGAAVVTMLWLQLSMAVLLFGAEVNAELERARRAGAAVLAGAGFGVASPADLPPAPSPATPRRPVGSTPPPAMALALGAAGLTGLALLLVVRHRARAPAA